MTDKIFDDFMRDKLRNHSSPVPDGLWEKIEKEKKRRPGGFFWSNPLMVMGLLFLIVACIGGLMWWQSNDNKAQATNNQSQQTIINKNITADKQNQTNKEQQTSASSNDDKNVITNSTSTTAHEQKIANNQTSTSINAEKVKTKNAAVKNTSPNKAISIRKTNILTIDEKYKGNETNKNSSNNKSQLSVSNKKIGNKKIGNTSSSILVANNYQVKELSTNNNQQISKADKMFTLAPKTLTLGQLIFIANKASSSNANKLLPSLQNMKAPSIDCPNNNNGRDDWYVELYASPDYSIKLVKGNAASNTYLQKKDSTESMKIGYTVGGRISKNIGEHLMLKAGLQFSQINERFTLRTENERRTTIVITTKNVVDAMGNTTTVSDTSTVTQIGYLVKTSNNRFRNIEVPVTLGYEFGNDNWKFSINGGAIINVASWYKGRTLDTAYQSVDLSSKSTGDVYTHSVGVSLYGSMSIIKPIAEKWDVFAEPYFRYSLSNLNSNTLGYNQRFNTYGLSLGLRYKLNTKRQHL